jgi:hypothetical protein
MSGNKILYYGRRSVGAVIVNEDHLKIVFPYRLLRQALQAVVNEFLPVIGAYHDRETTCLHVV